MRTTLIVCALAAVPQFFTACSRRPVEDDLRTALIPVRIDWSYSNIPVTRTDPTGGTYVHRVSIRFYPEDGSPPFERYLEGDIFEGEIDIPPGRYRVIAMNESVSDVRYWEDFITFSDADSYDGFAATVNPMPDADRKARFPYYEPSAGERLTVEPLHLASWSLDYFEVTEEMVPASRREGNGTRVADALTGISMRGLTHNINVTVHVINLVSVYQMPAAAKGFADKVYMASGATAQTPSTCLFTFNDRIWDTNRVDGTVNHTILSFGRLPQEPERTYAISLDVLLVNGELHTADGAMLFDVTGQVVSSPVGDINIDISKESGDIDLPYVEGGIAVDDWDDENINLN